MSEQLKAHIALFLVALIYGGNYTIAKEVMNNGYIQPIGFILLRICTATVLFQLYFHWRIRETVDRSDYLRFLLCAMFGVAINQISFFSGLEHTTPINASLIMTTTPILVLVSSALLIGEKITWRKILGIALGAAGAIQLIVLGKSVQFEQAQLYGDLLVLVNAVSFAIYLVLVKSLMAKYHPITVISWVFPIGLVLALPFGWQELSLVNWSDFPPSIWLAVLYVLLCATVLAYFFNTYALSIVQPSTVSIYIYLQPLLASAIALIFAKDVLQMEKVLAGILIFIGVYLVSIPSVEGRKAPKNVTNDNNQS
ncbi:MAG: DMT family transporter [Bacteroidota bacterium]